MINSALTRKLWKASVNGQHTKLRIPTVYLALAGVLDQGLQCVVRHVGIYGHNDRIVLVEHFDDLRNTINFDLPLGSRAPHLLRVECSYDIHVSYTTSETASTIQHHVTHCRARSRYPDETVCAHPDALGICGE